MVTKLGRFLRMLRLDRGELLKDMADKLSITPSYLSSIENGKRNPSYDIVQKISAVYQFDPETHDQLMDAYYQTVQEIPISLNGTTTAQSDLGAVFARRLNELSEADIDAIRTILSKKDR